MIPNYLRLLNEAAIHFESFPGGRDGNGMALLYRAIDELKRSNPSGLVSQSTGAGARTDVGAFGPEGLEPTVAATTVNMSGNLATMALDVPPVGRIPPEPGLTPAAKYPDLWEYHIAPSGAGPHAGNWKDKPHRLIYDLTRLAAEARDNAPKMGVPDAVCPKCSMQHFGGRPGFVCGARWLDSQCDGILESPPKVGDQHG